MLSKQEIKTNIERAISVVPQGVTLLAATKTVPAEIINFAADCGIRVIGENRVQELLEKYEHLDRTGLEIHFIGALQTNKVKYIIDKVDMIQSVDRLPLAEEIERQAAKRGIVMPVLAEINIGAEESKSGISPEEAYEFCQKLIGYPHLLLRGLMAIPPKTETKAEKIEYFSQMRKIFVDISDKIVDNINNNAFNILSLGMSGDYSEAIECGSNMIRLGSALFGNRSKN